MKQSKIIEMLPSHWDAVRLIYEQGIATKQATFQCVAPGWEEWDNSHLSSLRYVALTIDHIITGWAALTPVSSRCVYAGVAEVSVYIHQDHRSMGVGRSLLERLISESEQANIWTLQAGIFPENLSSIALHEKVGFRQVGFREKIGKLDGIWRDTTLLERRSIIAGLE